MKASNLNKAVLNIFVGATLAVSTAFSVGAQEIRAGVAPFYAGQAGIYITLPTPMPNGNYAVTVQATNTGGYSPTTECTYFNVLKKTATNFQVQHKTCIDGVPIALDKNVPLNWIAVEIE